ncbi:hypothetical protein J4E80_004782 [Alternaria sp. BMP 0032]|nr:hypothetical protein J4E80_004782 [Alternaria sp. BMP 0032]
MLRDITEAPLFVRNSIQMIYLGDPLREEALEITDDVVAAMIEALPNLEHVRIDGAPRVSDLTLAALLECDDIRTITLTTTRDRPNILRRKTLEDGSWPPKLVYLELSGQQLPASIIDYFEFWTSEKRSMELEKSLEIVYNFGRYYIFWRDGFPRWIQDYDFQKRGAWDPDFD